MNRVLLVCLSTVALMSFTGAACATSSGTTTDGNTTTTTDTKKSADPQKLAITNVIPFDVAACAPRALKLAPLTAEVLTGAMLSMNPATQECFVDLTTRDGQGFDLKGKITVDDKAVTVEVNGLGASASGKACVEAALKKLPLAPLPAGSKPVSAEIPLGASPQMVKLGDNTANDIVGQLRLAQSSFCDCYASVATSTPPSLKTEVEVLAGGAVKATFTTTDAVSTCLAPKIQALKLGDQAGKLTWPLLLKNSYAGALEESAPAALRFQQFDGMRAQRTGDVLIAAGQRGLAAVTYDEAAQKYKKKPAAGLLEELKKKCAEVITGDDGQINAVKSLVAVLTDSQKLATAEKAKDAQWAQVETMLGQQLTTTTAEVVRLEDQKKKDEAACPKTKY
ncbi:MAG: hypothetical protein QM817_23340 [Archangium sp.]